MDKRFQSHKIWLGAVVVFVVGFLVYANTYQNTFLYGDEEDIILRNHYLRDWKFLPNFFTENYIAGSGKLSNFYRPFQLLVYALIVHIVGVTPWPFHLASILFHALSGLLIYLLFLKLLGVEKERPSPFHIIVVLAALLWVVHPIHTEELALSSGLASPTHLFWMLSGLLCFLNFDKKEKIGERFFWYIGSLFSFIFAFFSKESAIIFPGLLLGTHIVALKQGVVKKRRLKNIFCMHLPFWVIALLYVTLRITLFNFDSTLNFYDEENVFTQNFSCRIYTLISILGYGLKIIFFPLGLHPERACPVFTTFLLWKVWLPFLVLSGIGVFAILNWRDNPLVGFGLFWFLFSYLPMSNLVAKINALCWDHWFYTPSVGVLLGLSSLVKGGKWVRKVFIVLFALSTVILFVYTSERNRNWRDNETFCRYVLSYEPGSAKTWNNLAMALADKGQVKEAVEAYLKAIELSDIYPQTHHNLANLYQGLGQYNLAEREYLNALEMDRRFYHSYLGLGNLYLARGEVYKAVIQFRKALEIYPYLPEVEAFLKRFSR